MKKQIFILISLFFSFILKSQIVIDNNAPYNVPAYLVDNILLGGGVTATNHTYQGEPSQIGWFNAINTPLGIDSGVVMGSGDIYSLDPVLGSTFPFLPNTVTDPDLLAVANSVPPLLPPPYTNFHHSWPVYLTLFSAHQLHLSVISPLILHPLLAGSTSPLPAPRV